jgi:hypothetical protein
MSLNMQKEIRKELNELKRRRGQAIRLSIRTRKAIFNEIGRQLVELQRMRTWVDGMELRALGKLDRRIAVLNGRLS